jgi:hypothetical protein
MLPSHFSKIHFNIVLLSTPVSHWMENNRFHNINRAVFVSETHSKASSLLGCYAVLTGKYLRTFQMRSVKCQTIQSKTRATKSFKISVNILAVDTAWHPQKCEHPTTELWETQLSHFKQRALCVAETRFHSIRYVVFVLVNDTWTISASSKVSKQTCCSN